VASSVTTSTPPRVLRFSFFTENFTWYWQTANCDSSRTVSARWDLACFLKSSRRTGVVENSFSIFTVVPALGRTTLSFFTRFPPRSYSTLQPKRESYAPAARWLVATSAVEVDLTFSRFTAVAFPDFFPGPPVAPDFPAAACSPSLTNKSPPQSSFSCRSLLLTTSKRSLRAQIADSASPRKP